MLNPVEDNLGRRLLKLGLHSMLSTTIDGDKATFKLTPKPGVGGISIREIDSAARELYSPKDGFSERHDSLTWGSGALSFDNKGKLAQVITATYDNTRARVIIEVETRTP